MADEIDAANDHMMRESERLLKDAREKASAIPAGEPGDCAFCGEYNPRLVGSVCSPCRDVIADTKRRFGR